MNTRVCGNGRILLKNALFTRISNSNSNRIPCVLLRAREGNSEFEVPQQVLREKPAFNHKSHGLTCDKQSRSELARARNRSHIKRDANKCDHMHQQQHDIDHTTQDQSTMRVSTEPSTWPVHNTSPLITHKQRMPSRQYDCVGSEVSVYGDEMH